MGSKFPNICKSLFFRGIDRCVSRSILLQIAMYSSCFPESFDLFLSWFLTIFALLLAKTKQP